MAKTVSDQLVSMLVEAGIERIYAVTGDSLNPLNDAIRRDGRIQWVHVRNEEAGAFAASAEAQLKGIACCAGSSGPGHVHLINGLYDAHRSQAPVIAIASTCATTEFGSGYFQETDTKKLFADCSHYNEIATTPYQVPRMLQAALQHAINQKGVAVLGLPGDVAEEDAVDIGSSLKVYPQNSQITPADSEIDKLAHLLNSHEKVAIFGGIGCKGAHDEVLELAKKLNAPVAYSYRGKMELEYDNPNAVGMSGLLGITSGYETMHEADVLLLLGTDFPYTPFMPTKNKIIQIDIKAERLGRRCKLDMGLQGDIKSTVKNLLPLIQQKSKDSFLREQKAIYKKAYDHLNENVYDDQGKTGAIHPEYVAKVIDNLASDSAIFTVDTGMTNVWGARFLSASRQREMLGSFVHGSMANAMPQAIGAAMSHPEKEIWALCGDGGLTMLLGDLMTIAQYQLPVKIVVFNNRSLGMVKLEMQVAGIPDWQTDMVNPKFEMLAESMGIRGFSVEDPEKVEGTLKEFANHQGPALINVFTDPNALAMPPKIEFDQVKGFALSMSKLMLNGRMKDVIDTVKSNINHIDDFI